MNLFDKIKSLLPSKEKEDSGTSPKIEEPRIAPVFKLEYHRQLKCKIHWDYQGVAVPINNCPICQQIYEQKLSR